MAWMSGLDMEKVWEPKYIHRIGVLRHELSEEQGPGRQSPHQFKER